jgi:hypothetical protein
MLADMMILAKLNRPDPELDKIWAEEAKKNGGLPIKKVGSRLCLMMK